MPDLVLDLDASPPSRVREYDASSEDTDMNLRYEATESQLQARKRAGEVRDMVNQRRQVTPQMVTSLINPWRVTQHDIMSVALRGVTAKVVPQASDVPSSEDRRNPRIVRLTQSHKDHYASDPTQAMHLAALRKSRPSPEVTLTAMDAFIVKGDPRRNPDFVKDLHLHSGIPVSTTKNNMNLLRWMMVKHEAGNLSRNAEAINKNHFLTPGEVVQALMSQKSLAGVRRIVFQCLAGGVDVNDPEAHGIGETSRTIPSAIRDACLRFMNRPRPVARPQEVLTFVNNLAQAVPHSSKDMLASILGIRLRCLAEMCLFDFTAQTLGASADSINKLAKSTTVDMAEDLAVTLETWNQVLETSDGLQEVSARRQLFRLVTGCSASNHHASLRHMLSQVSGHSNSKSRACIAYITLLGRLGALRTLHKDWNLHVSDLRSHNDADSIAAHLIGALSPAARRLDSGHAGSISSMDLAECIALDEQFIGAREESSANGGSEKKTLPAISFQALDDIMARPFDQCMAAVQCYSQH